MTEKLQRTQIVNTINLIVFDLQFFETLKFLNSF